MTGTAATDFISRSSKPLGYQLGAEYLKGRDSIMITPGPPLPVAVKFN